MTETKINTIISIATSALKRAQAVEFINSTMIKTFKCDPPVTQGLICTAMQGLDLVGTIVLLAHYTNTTFPIEDHFDFYGETGMYDRDLLVQGSRWIAVKPSVSDLLLQASFVLSLAFGKQYMLIEAKPYSIKRLHELGVTYIEVPEIRINLERVREIEGSGRMDYFLNAPFPTLYLIDLQASLLSI